MNTRVPFSPIIAGTMRLGAWGASFDTAQYQAFIEESIALGVTTFDHADIYGGFTTEGEFGKVLQQKPSLREKMQIITKCGIRYVSENRPENRIKSYDSTKEYIIQSVENSLRELNTDHIDVLLIHRPDFLMDPDEIGEAVQILNEQDKIIDFGVSNFNTSQFDLLNDKVALCTNQIEISIKKLAAFNNGSIDQCHRYRLPVMAWSPLAGGSIFSNTPTTRDVRIIEVARPMMEKYNCELDQLLLAWLAKHPAWIIPVIGTSKIERLRSATKAMDIKISHEEWYDLYQASTGEKVA